MSELSLENIGKTISFEVYPSSKLGDKYRNVVLEGFLDYETAKLFDDINKLAVNVYPLLPEGTPKDYKQYKYVKVRHSNNAVSVLALEWINLDTVVASKETIVTVQVSVDTLDAVDRLRKTLQGSGFTNITITT